MTVAGGPTWALGRQVQPRDSGGLIPPPGSIGTAGSYVYDTQSARRVPGVARCIQLYGGMLKQMEIDVYRGADKLPTPRLVDRPDPVRGRPWFVQVSVEDYLLNGNSISLVTTRGADGWPTSVQWLPAQSVYITWTPYDPDVDIQYFYYGTPLPLENVIHVRRGADRYFPVRGVGVVEEFLATLDRVAMEEEYERSALSSGAVPSVAIIAPGSLTKDVADEAKSDWLGKYGGPSREPAILPNGTQIVPLAWSPSDTQLTEARHMSLTDVANAFNVDGYWLGAAVSGMTYKTAAPQYQQILRTSLEPVIADFESEWSYSWLPRGQVIRFDRAQLLRDDLATTATASAGLYGAGIVNLEEARQMVGLPPVPEVGGTPVPPAIPVAVAAPEPNPADQPAGGATP
jgi:HK97 family phage portal protein